MANKEKKVEIKQLEDAPVTVEILAQSIVRIDVAVKKLLNSVKDACEKIK